MRSDFFKSSNAGEARKLCPHIAAALDVLQDKHGFRIERVAWVNRKAPELVVALDKKIPIEVLQRNSFERLVASNAL